MVNGTTSATKFGGTSSASPAKGKKEKKEKRAGARAREETGIHADVEIIHSFGVHGPVRNNVGLLPILDEHGTPKDHAIFPSGQHVAMMRIEDGDMRFLVNKMRQVSGGRGGSGGKWSEWNE